MAFPNTDGINQAVNALQADPLVIYAFAADKQRLPFNTGDLNTFTGAVSSFWAAQGPQVASPNVTTDFVYQFIQDVGAMPSSGADVVRWLLAQGYIQNASSNPMGGYSILKYPSAGTGYPPNGGAVDPPGTAYNVTPISSGQGTVGTAPSANGQTTTGTAPSPVGQGFSGAFSNVGQWVSQHPLEIAGSFAAYLIATGKIRLDRLL